MTSLAVSALLTAAAFALPLSSPAANHKEPASASAQAAPLSDGEIRRVDKDAKKITVRHGPLANLDMPAMTMVFQVEDPAMLDRVKPGDRVKFQAEKIGGAFTITRIEPAQ